MADIALYFNNSIGEYDCKVANGDLIGANPLDTAVIISLLTWARADADEVDEGAARFGWWGDKIDQESAASMGSKLYLLKREKITDETLAKAEDYIRQALQWMIDDSVVSEIEINLERHSTDNSRVDGIVTLKRGDITRTMKFNDLWSSL
ncbi:MAG: phage GP46 family protein [Alphaproteobacteria bacterium]|nr:phage GP46 family protein [Alphaproteobacteria bacterium]